MYTAPKPESSSSLGSIAILFLLWNLGVPIILCLKLLSRFFHGEGEAGAEAEFFRPGYSVTWVLSAAVDSFLGVDNGALAGGLDDGLDRDLISSGTALVS